MAQMIPEIPRKCSAASKEDIMFNALKNLKPDSDYFVFHSMRFGYWGKCFGNEAIETLNEHEADFVIFNPKKGILVIEGKSGEILRDQKGHWLQKNGKTKVIHEIDPYTQASNIKWHLFHLFKKTNNKSLINKCKFQHCVWFINTTKDELLKINAPEMEYKQTLTYESIDDIQRAIDYVYDLPVKKEENGAIDTNLTETEAKKVIDEVLNPTFNIGKSESIRINLENKIMEYVLKDQQNILNYIEEQKSAIISGAAGTGKTRIALEKARRHSIQQERVLFLCYNKLLCQELRKEYENEEEMENIDFYTLDKLCYEWCGSLDYKMFKEKIYNSLDSFPYRHIIIDEGQDFGRREHIKKGRYYDFNNYG